MKKLCTFVLAIFAIKLALANPVINSMSSNGTWKTSSTWSLNRLPMDGDTVIIPAGSIVVIDDVQNLSTSFLYIEVYGTLKFSNGKLWLSSSSTVRLYSDGSITSSGSSSETLKIGGVTKYTGTDNTLTGPLFASASTGTSPSGFSSGSDMALPVKFIGFNVARQNNDVLVQWTTAEEMNSRNFEVQRSENGIDWTTVSSIAAAGNSSATHSYSYTDKNIISKLVYYRIRQVDMDGKFSLTPVRIIKNDVAVAEVKITAASSNSIYVHFSAQVKGNVVIRLTTSNGQVISQETVDSPVGQVIVPVQNSNKGIYIVTVADGQELKFSKQVSL